jgi:hypothetical protein
MEKFWAENERVVEEFLAKYHNNSALLGISSNGGGCGAGTP